MEYGLFEDDYIVRSAKVVDVEDPVGSMRIKVKLHPVDDNIPDDDIPWCFPLNPIFIHICPKKGESVFVFLPSKGAFKAVRYYIGPIIPQDYYLYKAKYSPNESQMLLNESNAQKYAQPDPARDPKNNGTMPAWEDIALRGRANTDLILKDSEIRLRAGFKIDPLATKITNRMEYNQKDQGYIQIKYQKGTDNKGKEYNSLVNVVGDRINLLTHDSRDGFNLNDPDNMISDEEMAKVFEQAHPLPYGDELIQFLKDFVRLFQTHTHPYPMMPPTFNAADTETLATDLDKMLSTTIKIS